MSITEAVKKRAPWLNGGSVAAATGLAAMAAAYLAITLSVVGDLRDEMRSLRGEMGSLRGEMRDEMRSIRGEMSALRGDVRQEIDAVRDDLRDEIGAVRSELHEFRIEVRGDIARLDAGQQALAEQMNQMRGEMREFGGRLRAVEVGLAGLMERKTAHTGDAYSPTMPAEAIGGALDRTVQPG